MYGVPRGSKALTCPDHTSAFKTYGAITKINMYFSWTHKCIQGFKATYGYDARNAQLIGTDQAGLTTVDIKMSKDEYITKVDVKESTTK